MISDNIDSQARVIKELAVMGEWETLQVWEAWM